MKKIILLSVISLLSGIAMADGPDKTDTGINYNFIESGYNSFKSGSYTWTGYEVTGNFLVSEKVYFTANFTNLTPKTSGLNNIESSYLGLGYRYPVASQTDLFADVSASSRTMSSTDTGYKLTAGAKSKIANQTFVNGSYSYLSLGSDHYNLLSGELKFNMIDELYVYGRYNMYTGSDSIKTYSVGVGFNF